MELGIREFREGDYPRVAEIYQQGIDTRNATFQDKPKEWPEWNASTLEPCRLVAVGDGQVVGWAALYSVSDRCVFSGVAELSIYVAEEARGRGVGRALLARLIEASEEAGFWTLQAGIFPENVESLALHERLGFRLVGVREKLGCMAGRWRDVVLLERRSLRIGRE